MAIRKVHCKNYNASNDAKLLSGTFDLPQDFRFESAWTPVLTDPRPELICQPPNTVRIYSQECPESTQDSLHSNAIRIALQYHPNHSQE